MFFCQTSTSVNFSSNFSQAFWSPTSLQQLQLQLFSASPSAESPLLWASSLPRVLESPTSRTHLDSCKLGDFGKVFNDCGVNRDLGHNLYLSFQFQAPYRLLNFSPFHLVAFSPFRLLTFSTSHLLAFSTSNLFTLSPSHLLTFQVPSHWPLDTSHSPHTGTSQVKQYFLKKSKVTVGGEYSILMT